MDMLSSAEYATTRMRRVRCREASYKDKYQDKDKDNSVDESMVL